MATVAKQEQRNEKPIIFSGPTVRAILEGRKTQTRRVVKMKIETSHDGMIRFSETMGGFIAPHVWRGFVKCPYGDRGDRLWVREMWASHFNQRFHDEHGLSAPDYLVDAETREPLIAYAADRQFPMLINEEFMAEHDHIAWKAPIHMRRAASRLALEITNVEIERLQEISCIDIREEGIRCPTHDFDSGFCISECPDLCKAWREGWDALNARRGYSWQSNPWVWVISFQRISG